jgi:hypothetical protein
MIFVGTSGPLLYDGALDIRIATDGYIASVPGAKDDHLPRRLLSGSRRVSQLQPTGYYSVSLAGAEHTRHGMRLDSLLFWLCILAGRHPDNPAFCAQHWRY